MAITKTVQNKGDAAQVSNSGAVVINQTTGEIAIRKGTKRMVQINQDGFVYYDENNIKRITLGQNEDGQEQIVVYGADGRAQILVGQNPKNGSPVIAVSKGTADVLESLKNV